MAYLTGMDGAITLPTGYNAKISTWSATVSRVSLDMTSLGEGMKNRTMGIIDMVGSAGGHMTRDVGSSTPGYVKMKELNNLAGDSITLTHLPDPDGGSATKACSIAGTCIIDNIAVTSDVNGDATITFNFMLSGGAAPTVLWEE